MALVRKPLAKYGAKIPVAPNTGAKQAKPGDASPPEEHPAKAKPAAGKGGDRKRRPGA
jgi:hypothetical protein